MIDCYSHFPTLCLGPVNPGLGEPLRRSVLLKCAAWANLNGGVVVCTCYPVRYLYLGCWRVRNEHLTPPYGDASRIRYTDWPSLIDVSGLVSGVMLIILYLF